MSIKLKILGNQNTTNLHSLLMGLDLPDQHPIETIIGLRAELDKRYMKPAGGIPSSDLADKFISDDMLQKLDDKTQAMYAECQKQISSNLESININSDNIEKNTNNIFNINTELGELKSKISDVPDITNFYGSSCISQVEFEATDDRSQLILPL